MMVARDFDVRAFYAPDWLNAATIFVGGRSARNEVPIFVMVPSDAYTIDTFRVRTRLESVARELTSAIGGVEFSWKFGMLEDDECRIYAVYLLLTLARR